MVANKNKKLMLTLMKPKYFMPVHGEYRMLKIHTELAESVGIPAENCFISDNGEIIGIYKIFSTQKCITVGVSQVCKMFHASKMMSSFTG
jgi:mRNA degradation ribonuclease J1/J2